MPESRRFHGSQSSRNEPPPDQSTRYHTAFFDTERTETTEKTSKTRSAERHQPTTTTKLPVFSASFSSTGTFFLCDLCPLWQESCDKRLGRIVAFDHAGLVIRGAPVCQEEPEGGSIPRSLKGSARTLERMAPVIAIQLIWARRISWQAAS